MESVTPREFAGQNTFRNYRFQTYFAANLLLKMLENKDKDGMILMDYFDDVVFIDNDNAPTLIKFYQVKTNKECKISVSTMINNEFIQKMAWNLEQFKENNCCSIFVSNGLIDVNFGSSKKEKHIKGYTDFLFSSLEPISITTLLNAHQMSEEALVLLKTYISSGVDLSQIYLLKTDFSLDDFENDFLGKFANYFAETCPYSSVVEARAISDSIIQRLSEKQGSSFSPIVLSFDEIKTKKGIKISEISNIIKNISIRSIPTSFDSLYDFAINTLHYDFEGKNIVFLSQKYSQFKIDYVQYNTIVDEIIFFLKNINIDEISNSDLFRTLDELLKNSRLFDDFTLCQKYHDIFVTIYLYKLVKGVEL